MTIITATQQQDGSTQILVSCHPLDVPGGMSIILVSGQLESKFTSCLRNDQSLIFSSLSIGSWTGGASLLSLGLTVGQTMGVVVLPKVFIGLLGIGNGWIGAGWHICYTVAQRFKFIITVDIDPN